MPKSSPQTPRRQSRKRRPLHRPRTPQGKARSAQNARKHQFTGSTFAVVRLDTGGQTAWHGVGNALDIRYVTRYGRK